MAEIVPYNNGLDFGQFPDAASLPEASGSPNTSASLRVGARAYVIDVGEYTCTDATSGAAAWALTGSITGGGGGAIVGPFTCTVAVGDTFSTYSGGAWVATSAGSITAISGYLSAAASGDVISMDAFVNGSPVGFATAFGNGQQSGAEQAAAGTYPVAYGDIVLMVVTGGPALANTPDFVGSIEIAT